MPNQTPLNPDALDQLFAVAMMEVLDAEKLQPGDRLAHVNDIQEVLNRLEKNILAVAQPVVTTFEESDALPVGSVALDVDGNTARRFPDGWRTTVVEADGRVWLSGHMEDPDLPARVLYRPEVIV